MKDLYEKGLNKISEMDETAVKEVLENLNDIAPDIGKYIIEFGFGQIYSRTKLDLKQRELITLSSLLTQGGCENEIKFHIGAALNSGLTKEEIIDAFTYCIPYVGFPKVLNAVFAAKEIFNENLA